MEHAFWHERWDQGQIGFHEGQPNRLLVRYFDRLGLPDGARVFLPLCGKTRDIAWLLEQGCRVAGAELSARAVTELFDELGLTPDVRPAGSLTRQEAGGLVVYVGDFFDLTGDVLGEVDAVYDRAALVALPADLRRRYASHLMSITGNAPQLLVTFEYDPAEMDGPPFSLTATEIERHYAAHFRIERLQSRVLPEPLKGLAEATEAVSLLRPSMAGSRGS